LVDWVLPTYQYQPKWLIFISLSKCSPNVVIFLTHADILRKKHSKTSQDSYLAATLAGAFS